MQDKKIDPSTLGAGLIARNEPVVGKSLLFKDNRLREALTSQSISYEMTPQKSRLNFPREAK